MGVRSPRRLRHIRERVCGRDAMLGRQAPELPAELLRKLIVVGRDQRASVEAEVTGGKRMNGPPHDVRDDELAIMHSLVIGLARNALPPRRQRGQGRVASEVRGRTCRRLRKTPRLAFDKPRASEPERKHPFSLHRARLPRGSRAATLTRRLGGEPEWWARRLGTRAPTPARTIRTGHADAGTRGRADAPTQARADARTLALKRVRVGGAVEGAGEELGPKDPRRTPSIRPAPPRHAIDSAQRHSTTAPRHPHRDRHYPVAAKMAAANPSSSTNPARAPLVLASRSPQRRAILDQLRIAYEALPVDVEEISAGPASEVACANALAKACAGLLQRPGRTVLGVDTVVVLDGEIFGKPAGEQDAAATLKRLQGRTHQVVSGLALLEAENTHVVHEATEVTFRELDETIIARYVASGEWCNRAGGYAIQGQGAGLVRRIMGDYLNVVGLPVTAMLDLDLSLILRQG